MSQVYRSYTTTYERNRRLEIPSGTKEASVVVRFTDGLQPREEVEAVARQEVEGLFLETFGQPQWDTVEITFVHLTFEVLGIMRQVP